jgi:hypothetical protein
VRRAALVTAGVVAALVGAAVAAVAARDAVYWDRPLPGAEVRAVALDRPVAATVGDERYEVRPAEALRIDRAATERALWEAGRGSFLGRMRQLVDPTPPDLVVHPVLVPRGGTEAIAERLSAQLPRSRRAQVVSRGAALEAGAGRLARRFVPRDSFEAGRDRRCRAARGLAA